jgi:uncharacterized protein (TIGR01319 family)
VTGDFVTRPDGLTEDDDRYLARLARGIAARGLTAPAVLALECLRPAAFLGGQAMRLLSPLVPLVASGEDWDRLAQLMEVRGSVERLLSHLEALPEALAGRERGGEPGRQAYAVVDCGSTTSKAVLLARIGGRYRLVGRAEAPTTVEAPVEDVMVGVRDALDQLQDRTGYRILDEDGRRAAGDGDDAVGAVLATSSAGGGLQMLVLGLVRSLTAAAAERAALGAGAIVADVLAWNDDEDTAGRLGRLRRSRPDMVLLAGGTDGGAVDQVVALAEQLAAADLRPRWGDGLLPVIFAGNADAAPAVAAALAGRAEVVTAPNLRPAPDIERPDPVRRVVHEVFLGHVMARAPGYPDLQRLCSAPVLPTPAGFAGALSLLSDGRGGDVVAVDLGGATCDVFSVRDGAVFRSVSANLGLSYSLGAVCLRAGWRAVARWLPMAIGEDDLRDRVRNKMIRPTTLPQTPEDLLLEQAAAREALRLALVDHEQALAPVRDASAGPTGVEALLAAEPETPPAALDWNRVRLLLGSGGPLAHAPSRRQAAAMLIDACRPVGVTELAVDSVFVLPHLGALAAVDPEAAASVLDADALVTLGTCIAPVGASAAAEGSLLATVTVDDGDPVPLTAGAVTSVALDGDARVRVAPVEGVDVGAGPGESLDALVRGGPAGLILDGRGAAMAWPAAELDRRRTVASWLSAQGAMPGEAAS